MRVSGAATGTPVLAPGVVVPGDVVVVLVLVVPGVVVLVFVVLLLVVVVDVEPVGRAVTPTPAPHAVTEAYVV